MLVKAGMLNQTAACTNTSGARAAVQSVASNLLDAAVSGKVPGEGPVSFQTDALGEQTGRHQAFGPP